MFLIRLTDVGRRVAHEFRLVVHRQQKVWMATLTEQEQDQFIDMLHRLQAALADSQA